MKPVSGMEFRHRSVRPHETAGPSLRAGCKVIFLRFEGSGTYSRQLLELGENVACRADVGGGDAVGDFQLQGCGIDLGFAKNGANSVGQMRAGEVAGGDVGGDAEGRE